MDTSHKEAPEVLAGAEVYRGRIIDVVLDTVREGELTYVREVVRHPGARASWRFMMMGRWRS